MVLRIISSHFVGSSARAFLRFSDYLFARLDHLTFWDIRVVCCSWELYSRVEHNSIRVLVGSEVTLLVVICDPRNFLA